MYIRATAAGRTTAVRDLVRRLDAPAARPVLDVLAADAARLVALDAPAVTAA